MPEQGDIARDIMGASRAGSITSFLAAASPLEDAGTVAITPDEFRAQVGLMIESADVSSRTYPTTSLCVVEGSGQDVSGDYSFTAQTHRAATQGTGPLSATVHGPQSAYVEASSPRIENLRIESGWDDGRTYASLTSAANLQDDLITMQTEKFELKLPLASLRLLLNQPATSDAELALQLGASLCADADLPLKEFAGGFKVQADDGNWYVLRAGAQTLHLPSFPRGVGLAREDLVIRSARRVQKDPNSPAYVEIRSIHAAEDPAAVGIHVTLRRPEGGENTIALPASLRRFWEFAKWDAITSGRLATFGEVVRSARSSQGARVSWQGEDWSLAVLYDEERRMLDVMPQRADLAELLMQARRLSRPGYSVRPVAEKLMEVIEADPEGRDGDSLIVAYHSLARIYAESSEMSLPYLERAWFYLKERRASPLKLDAAQRLAGIYAEMGRYAEAENLLEICLALAEKLRQPVARANALLEWARLHSVRGKTIEAIRFYQQARQVCNAFVTTSEDLRVQVVSARVIICYELAQALLLQGKWDLATDAFQQILREIPHSETQHPLMVGARFGICQAAQSRGDFLEAERQLQDLDDDLSAVEGVEEADHPLHDAYRQLPVAWGYYFLAKENFAEAIRVARQHAWRLEQDCREEDGYAIFNLLINSIHLGAALLQLGEKKQDRSMVAESLQTFDVTRERLLGWGDILGRANRESLLTLVNAWAGLVRWRGAVLTGSALAEDSMQVLREVCDHWDSIIVQQRELLRPLLLRMLAELHEQGVRVAEDLQTFFQPGILMGSALDE